MSRRTERMASILRQELASIIMHELDDPRLVGLPSITRVKVSEDLAIADVYMTIMGSEGKQTAALNALKHSAGMMRSTLSKTLEMRQVPYIKFHIDESIKKERQVLDLLRMIAEENAAKDAAQGGTAPAGEGSDAQKPQGEAAPEDEAQKPQGGTAEAGPSQTAGNDDNAG